MNDTLEGSTSGGVGSAVQTSAGQAPSFTSMQPDGLNANPVKPTIETFHLSELAQEASGGAGGFQDTGEVLHRTVIDAGGIHAAMAKIANGDFATHSDEAESSTRDGQGIGREVIEDGETAEVNEQNKARETVLSEINTQWPQAGPEESLPGVGINNSSPADESINQKETPVGFAQPIEQSVPEGDLSEDLLKLLTQITAKIEEEEDPEERVSLVEALIALIKAMVALGIKVAKEAGKDLIKPIAPKEI